MDQDPGGAPGAGTTIACRSCGREIDASQALYSKKAELICQACSLSREETIDAAFEQRQARLHSLSTLGLGALSLVFNPLFLASVPALVLGVRSLRRLDRPEIRAALGEGHRARRIMTIVGLSLAALGTALWLVLMPIMALLYVLGEGMRHAL